MNVFGASVWGGSIWTLYLLSGLMVKEGLLRPVGSKRLLSVALLFGIPCLALTFLQLKSGTFSMEYGSIFVAVPSVCLFELICRTEGRLSELGQRGRAILVDLSTYSFGVYMIHVWIRSSLGRYISTLGILPEIRFLVGMVLVGLLSYALARLLSKNELAKKYLLLAK